MPTKFKETAKWKNLTPTQKRNRIFVYSIMFIFYACGLASFFMRLWPLGIILVLLPSIALYILAKLPEYIIRNYCRRAEREYQLHKNDLNSDRIYLSGEQMYKYLHGDVIDLKDGKTRPFSYKSLMASKERRERAERETLEKNNKEEK